MPRFTFKLIDHEQLDVEITITLSAPTKEEAFKRLEGVDLEETVINSCEETR